jgi:tetratricopeptide (TPR) repeat protein
VLGDEPRLDHFPSKRGHPHAVKYPSVGIGGVLSLPSLRALGFPVVSLVAVCVHVRAQEASVTSSVQLFVKEGDTAFGTGDYATARLSFEKALQIVRQLSADSLVRYDILKRLTSTSAALGRFAEAESYLQQAIEWRESNVGPKDPRIADDLLLSINLKIRTKEFDQALATARRVEAMHAEAYTSDSIPVADDLLRIGQIYLAEKKPNEALEALTTAIGVRTKLVGSLDPGLLPALDHLIDAFRAIAGGECPGCERVYRQALAIRETLYGTSSAELISTIEGLADVYSSEKMFAAAEPLYQRLLALWENLVGEDHPMVAVTLDKLVVFYAEAGKPERAREALARSVAIRAHFLAVGLAHQAADAISENRSDLARTLYNRALAALELPGPTNEELIGEIKNALSKLQNSTSK